MIDRKYFFDTIKQPGFNMHVHGLSQKQVDGYEDIFKEWDTENNNDLRQLAYMLATVYHETSATIEPIEEIGKGKGRKYGIPDAINGKVYYGRGFVQLTWKHNYSLFGERLGLDLVNDPELACTLEVATYILFEGMLHGLFTGKKLSDYFNKEKCDYVNARRIINGLDKADLIADYAPKFMNALMPPSKINV